MIRIHVREWNNRFDRPGVLDIVRRKITGSQMGHTVLVDFEDAVLTGEQMAYVMRGFLDYKVKFCGSVASLPHPLPPDALLPEAPRPRRRTRDRPPGPEEPDA
jgi:hypothetical protein